MNEFDLFIELGIDLNACYAIAMLCSSIVAVLDASKTQDTTLSTIDSSRSMRHKIVFQSFPFIESIRFDSSSIAAVRSPLPRLHPSFDVLLNSTQLNRNYIRL